LDPDIKSVKQNATNPERLQNAYVLFPKTEVQNSEQSREVFVMDCFTPVLCGMLLLEIWYVCWNWKTKIDVLVFAYSERNGPSHEILLLDNPPSCI